MSNGSGGFCRLGSVFVRTETVDRRFPISNNQEQKEEKKSVVAYKKERERERKREAQQRDKKRTKQRLIARGNTKEV